MLVKYCVVTFVYTIISHGVGPLVSMAPSFSPRGSVFSESSYKARSAIKYMDECHLNQALKPGLKGNTFNLVFYSLREV